MALRNFWRHKNKQTSNNKISMHTMITCSAGLSMLEYNSLQFEVCRFINMQSVLKIPFQIAKSRENATTVLKIIFSTVKLYLK